MSFGSSQRPLKLPTVAMANTTDARDLLGVKAEMSTVMGVLGTSVHVQILDQPDAASVMRQIQQCNVAYSACHGISHSTNHSTDLLLQTATAKLRQHILTFRKVCENHRVQREIAYLSACLIAQNRAKIWWMKCSTV